MKIIFMLLFVVLARLVLGQIPEQDRYERDLNFNNDDITVVSMKHEGLALINEEPYSRQNMYSWKVDFLNTTLRSYHTTTLKFTKPLWLLGHDYHNGNVFVLFSKRNNKSSQLQLVALRPPQYPGVTYSINCGVDYKLTYFYVINQSAFFGGYIDHIPVVMRFDMDTKRLYTLPGIYELGTVLLDIRPNQNSTCNILLLKQTPTDTKINIRILDDQGTLLLEEENSVGRAHYILSAMSSSLGHDNLMVLGTWASKKNRNSCGLFFWSIHPIQKQHIKYVTFSQLQDFLEYLPRQKHRIKKREKKRQLANRRPSFTAQVNLHRIDEIQQGYSISGEVWHTQANTQNYQPYYPYQADRSSPFYPRYSTYRPFPMEHGQLKKTSRLLESFVVVVDYQGEWINDFSFPIKRKPYLSNGQKTDCAYVDRSAVSFYKEENNVYCTFKDHQHERTQQDTISLVNQAHQAHRVVSAVESNSGIQYGHENQFYAWGYQNYIPRFGKGKRKYIFYIQKIQVDSLSFFLPLHPG